MRLNRCHGCCVNDIFYSTAAGQVIAGLVKTLKNSEAVSFPDALRNFVADVTGLKIREDQDICPPCDRAALGFTCSYFRNQRGVELHLTVEKKVRSKLVGNFHSSLHL